MTNNTTESSNFSFLLEHDPIFFQLASVAEKMFKSDPNTTLVKLRQLAEALAQEMASKLGIEPYEYDGQYELINLLEKRLSFSYKVKNLFHTLRKEGNQAVHEFTTSHAEAVEALKNAYKLSIWYHGTFGEVSSDFKVKAFVLPKDPTLKLQKIHQEYEALKNKLLKHQKKIEESRELALIKEQEHQEYEQLIQEMKRTRLEQERDILEQEKEFKKQKKLFEDKIAKLSCGISDDERKRLEKIYKTQGDETLCYLHLDEDETLKMIDLKLNEAGWEADHLNLDYQKGTRPQNGKNMAIANWESIEPKSSKKSQAHYLLFIGLKAVAIIEVMQRGIEIQKGIKIAQQHSQNIHLTVEFDEWYADEFKEKTYRVPMVFASNGREYQAQQKTKTGIVFRDLRRIENKPRTILQWFSPEEIAEFLDRDDENLVQPSKNYSLFSFSFLT